MESFIIANYLSSEIYQKNLARSLTYILLFTMLFEYLAYCSMFLLLGCYLRRDLLLNLLILVGK